ncbi:MAG: endonuclease/exonuclease/phosphatase family protein [Thermoleophilia bacterium]
MTEQVQPPPPRFPRFGASVLLPAVTVMFGMQVLRVLLPLLVYVLRDRFGFQAMHLGGFALVLFAGSFLAGPLLGALGPRRLAMVTAIGVGLSRLLIQVWMWDPVIDLILAMVGTLFFLLYLPAALVRAGWRTAGGGIASGSTGVYALGILTGLGLDTALNGLLHTYDVAWRSGWIAPVLVAALVALQASLAYGDRLKTGAGSRTASACGRLLVGPWVALGPMLALQMLVFQNVARLTVLTGLSVPAAALLAVGAHALGLAVVGWLYVMQGTPAAARGAGGSPGSEPVAVVARILAIVAGLLLVLSVIPAAPEGIDAAVLFVSGQLASAYLLMVVVGSVGAGRLAVTPSDGYPGGYGRLSPFHGGGMMILVIFLFLAYSGYDIALPFSSDSLPPIAALVFGGCGVWAIVGRRRLDRAAGVDSLAVGLPERFWRLTPALLVAAVAVAPLVQWATFEPARVEAGTGDSVRVMTFNLHNGFATDGRLDLEALARVIEAEDPDIVALQEVSRGWVINGTVDVYSWLSQRLDMPGVYGPTAGPLWGNALLTRFPMIDHELVALPTPDLLLQRGYITSTVDLGGGDSLHVVATHYHHPDDGGPVRVLESEALLRAWDGVSTMVVMGDLNGRPGDPEIEMLRNAGLVEVLQAAGISPGYTYPSDAPSERIDYIWATPDLVSPATPSPAMSSPADVHITAGTASDHLGIAATLSVGE